MSYAGEGEIAAVSPVDECTAEELEPFRKANSGTGQTGVSVEAGKIRGQRLAELADAVIPVLDRLGQFAKTSRDQCARVALFLRASRLDPFALFIDLCFRHADCVPFKSLYRTRAGQFAPLGADLRPLYGQLSSLLWCSPRLCGPSPAACSQSVVPLVSY